MGGWDGNAVVVWVLCWFQGDRVTGCQGDRVTGRVGGWEGRQLISSMNEGMQTKQQQSRQAEIIGKHKAKH